MEPHVLLATRDSALIESVQVTAATLEVELRVASDPDAMRSGWEAAAGRLVGADVAARWGPELDLRGAHLVGLHIDELARCSAELGLPVLTLPGAASRLAVVLMEAVRAGRRTGRIVALMGSSGGVGVSTLTLSLALSAARSGARSTVVDAVANSGGLDLVVGAETAEGLRWADLAEASGELGDLRSALPEVSGVAVLSAGRASSAAPSPEAMQAVLGALGGASDVTFVDVGRQPPPVPVDVVLLVVGGDVRSVAAAQQLGQGVTPTAVVVRSGPGRGVPGAAVSRTLGVECAGVLSEDRALPRLAELGLPPVPGPARRHAREAARLWQWVRDA